MRDAAARLVKAILRARHDVRRASLDGDDLPTSEAEAYAIAFAQGATVAAWKIGGANAWSRNAFNNDRVFFGPLHPGELFVETEVVSVSGLVGPLVEPELMLQIADPRAQVSETAFSHMALGFVVPSTILPDALKPVLIAQICDRAGSGALWIGRALPFSASLIEAGVEIEMQRNDEEGIQGKSDQVIGGPLGAAADFLQQARALGAPLQRGQLIATGGMIPAIPAEPDDCLTLRSSFGVQRIRFA